MDMVGYLHTSAGLCWVIRLLCWVMMGYLPTLFGDEGYLLSSVLT